MDWDRIESNWPHWRGRIQERWSRLTNAHMDAIAGRRTELTQRLRELYGLTPEEADRQLANWERNLAVEEFEQTEIVLDDDSEPEANSRG